MSSPVPRAPKRAFRLLRLAGLGMALGLAILMTLKWRGLQTVYQAWQQGAYLSLEKDPVLDAAVSKMTPQRTAKIEAFRKATSTLLRSHLWPANGMVQGRDGTLLYKGCLRCANAPASTYLEKIPLFQEMAALLAPHDIRLIVVPVPSAYGVHPERLPNLAPQDIPLAEDSHPQLQAFCEALKQAGVQVVNPCMALRKAALEGQLCYYTYDSHWSPVAAEAAAKLLAEPLRATPAGPSPDGAISSRDLSIPQMHLSPDGGTQAAAPFTVRAVLGTTISTESPVVVMADSNGLDVYDSGDVPPTQIRCGIASQIAMELRQPVDLIYHAGGGPLTCRADFVRRCRSKPGYLQNKRVVVWCLAERALLQNMDSWPSLGTGRLEPPKMREPSPDILKKAPARAQVRIIAATPTIAPTETPYANVVLSCTAELVQADTDSPFQIVMWLDAIRSRRAVAHVMPKSGAVMWVDLTAMDLAKVKHPHLQVCEYRDSVEDFTSPAYYATPVEASVD